MESENHPLEKETPLNGIYLLCGGVPAPFVFLGGWYSLGTKMLPFFLGPKKRRWGLGV